MPWIVKFDKEEDFIGRWALESVSERGDENKLVGFTIDNGAVPTEGAAVVADGKPVGRVTSSRFSPTLVSGRSGWCGCPRTWPRTAAAITLADDGRAPQRDGADGALLRPRPGAAARMSFEFLAADATVALDGEVPAARSPIEWVHRGAGARIATRAGWRVVAGYGANRSGSRRLPALGRGRRRLLPGQARAPGRPRQRRRDRRRARRRRPADARAGRTGTTASGGARSAAGRVLAVTPPESHRHRPRTRSRRRPIGGRGSSPCSS